jgi:chromosome segregation ATPase
MAEVSLDFLGEQQTRVLAELGEMRAEMRAMRRDMEMLTRIVLRLDSTVDALRADIKTLWLNSGELRSRLERIEERVFAPGV